MSLLRSSDLAGLLGDEGEEPSPLETLVLNNTGVDDDAAAYISCCPSLRILELGSTKFERETYAYVERMSATVMIAVFCVGEGLFTILDACTSLERLNLTSCRGIDIAHRRNFFEVREYFS